MDALSVFRMDGSEPRLLGRINLDPVTFSYDPGYLADPDARAVSCSLPLRNEAYSESTLAPYFDGLLPEGAARRAIAAQLGIEPDNYLLLLLRCGLETIGDVAITNGEAPNPRGSYRRLSGFDLRALFSAMEELAESNSEARLSLAGTQGKAGLAHMPGAPMDEGWLQPLDGAASTHILKTGSLPDIPLLEYLCMKAAAACGIAVAPVHLLDFGRPVLCVERYDRRQLRDRGGASRFKASSGRPLTSVRCRPKRNTASSSPPPAAAVGSFIRMRSSRPIEDLEAFARITCFNYLVGNCDNHLKNLSILYTSTWKSFRLAPAYDLVSTTRFERFSRSMGMRIGSASVIDDVSPSSILEFGSAIGVDRKDIARICAELASSVPSAIEIAGETAPAFEALPYAAWDMREDMGERMRVLEEVAG